MGSYWQPGSNLKMFCLTESRLFVSSSPADNPREPAVRLPFYVQAEDLSNQGNTRAILSICSLLILIHSSTILSIILPFPKVCTRPSTVRDRSDLASPWASAGKDANIVVNTGRCDYTPNLASSTVFIFGGCSHTIAYSIGRWLYWKIGCPPDAADKMLVCLVHHLDTFAFL